MECQMNDLLKYRIDKSTEIGVVLVQSMVNYLQSLEKNKSDIAVIHTASWTAITRLSAKYLMLAYNNDLEYIKLTHIESILKGDYDDDK